MSFMGAALYISRAAQSMLQITKMLDSGRFSREKGRLRPLPAA
jgi:hypothetical protein